EERWRLVRHSPHHPARSRRHNPVMAGRSLRHRQLRARRDASVVAAHRGRWRGCHDGATPTLHQKCYGSTVHFRRTHMALQRRTLGRTGMEITALGFGAMELRGARRGPEVSDENADRVLNAVLDSGINYIDTSPDYGRSEEHIGRAIAHRRGEFFLASKCGCIVGTPPATPANLPNPHIFT